MKWPSGSPVGGEAIFRALINNGHHFWDNVTRQRILGFSCFRGDKCDHDDGHVTSVEYRGHWKQFPEGGEDILVEDGLGIMTWPRGDRYEGYFADGFRSGLGIHYFSIGQIYKGGFDRNNFHGHGVMIDEKGGHYEGQWKNGKREGWGVQTDSIRNVTYEGLWVDDRPSKTLQTLVEERACEAEAWLIEREQEELERMATKKAKQKEKRRERKKIAAEKKRIKIDERNLAEKMVQEADQEARLFRQRRGKEEREKAAFRKKAEGGRNATHKDGMVDVSALFCPLTRSLMVDPVQVSSGNTYERRAIEDLFEQGYSRDPLTHEVLENLTLVPNINLRNLIQGGSFGGVRKHCSRLCQYGVDVSSLDSTLG
jgi:hypothetical protein